MKKCYLLLIYPATYKTAVRIPTLLHVHIYQKFRKIHLLLTVSFKASKFCTLNYGTQEKILIYEVHTISFQKFFVWAFKIVVDSWKFSMLLLYILWDDWPIFMLSGLNEQLQQQLEYTLLKSDCYSWWISKMQSLSQTIWARWASIKFITLPIAKTLLPVTFSYSLSSGLTRSHKRTSMGRSRSCWNGTTSVLLPEEITSKGTRVPCVYYQ